MNIKKLSLLIGLTVFSFNCFGLHDLTSSEQSGLDYGLVHVIFDVNARGHHLSNQQFMTVKSLLRKGANPNVIFPREGYGGFGATALLAAVYRNDWFLVKTLLDAGANPALTVRNGLNALLATQVYPQYHDVPTDPLVVEKIIEASIEQGNICELLSQIDESHTYNFTAIEWMEHRKEYASPSRLHRERAKEIYKLMTDARDTYCTGNYQREKEPVNLDYELFDAARKANLIKAKMSLEQGANPNAIIKPDPSVVTTPLHAAVSESNHAIVRLLLNAGADLTTKNEKGLNPLMIAAQNGSFLDVKNIISYIENIEKKGTLHQTRARKRFVMSQGTESRLSNIPRDVLGMVGRYVHPPVRLCSYLEERNPNDRMTALDYAITKSHADIASFLADKHREHCSEEKDTPISAAAMAAR